MNITCLNCGWVHFQVSRKQAENEIKRFNEYFEALPMQQQEDFYGGKESSIYQYEHCFSCGGSYKNFRDYRTGDCPDGCTLQSIINKLE